LTASKSNSYPSLDFVGNFYSTGQGLSSSDSYSELMGADRPGYYAGLRLKYNFGSDIQNETLINKKLDRELQEAILKRQTLEAKDNESRLKRSVQANYSIAISAQKQKEYREKAQQELNRSYNQGRTDIQTLITAMNALFNSEVTYVNALGDYAISLNQWAAYRDELIPDQNDSVTESK
jgi:outer membrane protein TolC